MTITESKDTMTDTDTTPTSPVAITDPSIVSPGWKTSEFYGAWAAKLLGAAYAAGLIGDGTLVARIAGLAVVVLAYFGYTVSRTLVKTAAVVLLVGVLGGSGQMACSDPTYATTASVDCTKADKGALASEATTLLAAPSWAAFESDVITALETIGGCAMLDTIDRYRPPAGDTAVAGAPVNTHALVERVRARFGGVTWATASGPR
jgi:hypothetical protein